MRGVAAPEPVKDWSRRLKIRRVRYQARRRGLVGRAELKYNMVKIGGLENNAGIIGRICFMYNNNSNRNGAAPAGGFMASFAIMLAMGLGLLARPAVAQPFAYVANDVDGTVSVINTATNTVMTTLTVGTNPSGVAVTPDGTHAYVSNNGDNNVSVIDTATNTVEAATIAVGVSPNGVAVTPDGKHVYVANFATNSVSVIDTATNTVVATLAVGFEPHSVAVTPDGKHAYVTSGRSTVSVIDTASNTVEAATLAVGNGADGVAATPDGKHVYVTNAESNNVSVIDTATNTVEAATLAVGNTPIKVAVTPDGKHAYVTNANSNSVSVIDTATNTVEAATLAVGRTPLGVAVTPDGKHAYVANGDSDNVSVIDTATNTVEAVTIMVGNVPFCVGIVPPPVGVPFLAFNAKLEIDLDRKPNKDSFELESHFTLSSTAPAINPVTDPVTLQVGTFTTTIPAGSFKKHRDGDGDGAGDEHEEGLFTFHGVIDGMRLEALIKRTGTLRYAFDAEARHANLTGTTNPVPVMLTIGGNSGMIPVKAAIIQLDARASASP
ncbi:MAG: YncE family protein [Pseudomonadota bacterium]|nr:YncE family protein [Pseudomonadota bacterium]